MPFLDCKLPLILATQTSEQNTRHARGSPNIKASRVFRVSHARIELERLFLAEIMDSPIHSMNGIFSIES